MKARIGFYVAMAAILLAAVPAVHAQEATPADNGPNIRITLTIGGSEDQNGLRERVYRLVTQPGARADMLMGWRTPIPAKRQEVTAAGDVPTTTYTYQNIGVSAHLETRMIATDRIAVTGTVEVSGPRGGASASQSSDDTPPVIGTFQQNLAVTLQNGKPLRVAEVPDHEGGTLYLELRADIQE